MSDGRRKINKQSTGTVPKVKHRNNSTNERDSPRSWTNNLSTDLQRWNLVDGYRGTRRMNTVEEQRHLNTTVNGSITPNTSSSASRRNSGTVPKCDNISKYPDKKQIQDKLSQIREYLQITTSLMASIKNTGDQSAEQIEEKKNLAKMISDLKDSEAKLVDILDNYQLDDDKQILENEGCSSSDVLSQRNEKEDQRNKDMEMLREQQMSLMSLQQKAENKLKDARQIQEKLMSQCSNNDIINCSTSNKRDKNFENDFDAAIKELEERTKRLKEPSNHQLPQEKIISDIESLHNQIINLHNINDDRGQLIQILDNRDAELKSQHCELQTKLQEIQNRKHHVDQLVVQLQNIDECNENDDVTLQVKRIVTMKEQLNKLKDMLELVKTTETANSQEIQDLACDICTKTENFLQKQQPQISQENTYKQINKNDFICDKPQQSNNVNKMAIQVELEAKKRELEEIMSKHKGNGPSNLNQDILNDNKSEFSCSMNAYMDGAAPWIPDHNRQHSSDRYSSRDCSEDEVNEYLPHQNQKLTLPRYSDRRAGSELNYRRSKDRCSLPCTPERNIRRSLPPNYRESTNIDEENKNQVQKQLELIRSLCDSMLEQQRNGGNNNNNIQLRNNLTPSPLYLEPRRFTSPSPQNALNLMNPIEIGLNGNNTQNLLATNTLQTQSFMLNTLNQCCQMLWLQQKELISLRQMVTQLQQRLDSTPSYFDNNINQLTSPIQQNPDNNRPNQIRSNQKLNHVSAACSMPNLNQYNAINTNLDPTHHYTTPNNNMQSVRLMDTLNNVNLNSNNTLLHGVNANINPWNGQALNNQVAPGNRANNYWDNFRSYSRQNLLSTTKNNEGIHHNQQNLISDRTNPFHLMSLSNIKSNSQENTPIRGGGSVNRNVTIAPPDVLNINTNIRKINEGNNRNENEQQNYRQFYSNNETSSNTSLISDDLILKDCIPENARRRNEWHDDGGGAATEEHISKSKLFEELRENVYKEVANLISANEARPHFLIQLFRDLQMISSDPLRLKILQSIQTVITHSLITNNGQLEQSINEHELNQLVSDCFSFQSTVWSKKNPSSNVSQRSQDDPIEMQNSLKEIIPFLNDHEDDLIQHNFLLVLKHMLIESQSFQDIVKDSVFQKHFSNVLDDVLAQYNGKKVKDVKMHIIQTIGDLLRGELSFIQLIQETCPENCENDTEKFDTPNLAVNGNIIENNGQIENGDLAEADQGRGVEDDEEAEEEEGAVGGFWEINQEQNIILTPNIGSQIISNDMDLICEFPNNNAETQTQFMKQGLDQVPTRLPTKSRSNTPNKDRSTSSRSDQADF